MNLSFCLSALFLASLAPSLVTAQAPDDSLRQVLSLAVRADFAVTDPLGNLYVISPEMAVEKYAPDGRLLTRYTQNRLGRPALLDVTNPLKVLVWYADFRTVVWLDRSLTSLGELNLIDAGYPEVRTVGAAQDGSLWLYDEAGFRLRKISADGRPLFESQDMNLLFDQTLQISGIRENETGVLVAEARYGALQFDPYGQYARAVTLPGVKQFVLKGREVLFIREHRLCARALSFPPTPEHCRAFPPTADRVWLGDGTVILARDGRLEIWK
ncbi:MAG: hypothetical protein ACR2K1_06180 [Saprospiraceae bacterium]